MSNSEAMGLIDELDSVFKDRIHCGAQRGHLARLRTLVGEMDATELFKTSLRLTEANTLLLEEQGKDTARLDWIFENCTVQLYEAHPPRTVWAYENRADIDAALAQTGQPMTTNATPAEVERGSVSSDAECVDFLWGLLDDIDTASDMFKSDYEALARYVYRKQQERWKTGAQSDGYGVTYPWQTDADPALNYPVGGQHPVAQTDDSGVQARKAIEEQYGPCPVAQTDDSQCTTGATAPLTHAEKLKRYGAQTGEDTDETVETLRDVLKSIQMVLRNTVTSESPDSPTHPVNYSLDLIQAALSSIPEAEGPIHEDDCTAAFGGNCDCGAEGDTDGIRSSDTVDDGSSGDSVDADKVQEVTEDELEVYPERLTDDGPKGMDAFEDICEQWVTRKISVMRAFELIRPLLEEAQGEADELERLFQVRTMDHIREVEALHSAPEIPAPKDTEIGTEDPVSYQICPDGKWRWFWRLRVEEGEDTDGMAEKSSDCAGSDSDEPRSDSGAVEQHRNEHTSEVAEEGEDTDATMDAERVAGSGEADVSDGEANTDAAGPVEDPEAERAEVAEDELEGLLNLIPHWDYAPPGTKGRIRKEFTKLREELRFATEKWEREVTNGNRNAAETDEEHRAEVESLMGTIHKQREGNDKALGSAYREKDIWRKQVESLREQLAGAKRKEQVGYDLAEEALQKQKAAESEVTALKEEVESRKAELERRLSEMVALKERESKWEYRLQMARGGFRRILRAAGIYRVHSEIGAIAQEEIAVINAYFTERPDTEEK